MNARNIVGHETILLVDDDLRPRKSQKDVLESLGYHVLEVKNGKEAVTLYAEKQER
ncbi:MAG: hypothetical protein Q9M44_06070 [Ghiorsea sp.]|nr:hypothetical protein [Ghiorsea sp.]